MHIAATKRHAVHPPLHVNRFDIPFCDAFCDTMPNITFSFLLAGFSPEFC
jgi:hypothetical protein